MCFGEEIKLTLSTLWVPATVSRALDKFISFYLHHTPAESKKKTKPKRNLISISPQGKMKSARSEVSFSRATDMVNCRG